MTTNEMRAHYTAKYEDELALWSNAEVDEAYECGAITEAEADMLRYDEEEAEREEAEFEARRRECERAIALSYLEADALNLVSGVWLAGLVRRGVFTHEEFQELFC